MTPRSNATATYTANPYLPLPARIREVRPENPRVKTFVLEPADAGAEAAFSFEPGQFVMVSVPHQGEAPISISSPPGRGSGLTLTVRRAGRLTGAMHTLGPGDTVGIRGPYGRPFPMAELEGRDLLFVAGGIGLAPLRSALLACLAARERYGALTVLYGCRTPSDICFSRELDGWNAGEGLRCRVTVDRGDAAWQGRVGLVTTLFDEVDLRPERTSALVCGPEVMIRVVLDRLEEMGLAPETIFTTLERHMKCGIGLCGHCHHDGRLVCTDGPVFSKAELASG
ncbi:oxidoreductase [Dissulfurirhabdus thermomarina]|uniref:Oxidoreductase n=1 Tax=Dissulfurirhabdus thermomarina TaxID=1765737 RepID=A0A6N9TLD2_DISTH|nr:FAD/NAD(P)-binding protein [Dissulfurirhabdus thermomarina]NDY41858.1 oxidoreductase [Dissulfurirhabdus thermomarina]NMX22616.1 oxidoreductase [Dissulfurirhabdus thermomarina]